MSVSGEPLPGLEDLGAEILSAIRRHRLAVEALKVARQEHDEARKVVVELLHRQGLEGFSL